MVIVYASSVVSREFTSVSHSHTCRVKVGSRGSCVVWVTSARDFYVLTLVGRIKSKVKWRGTKRMVTETNSDVVYLVPDSYFDF